MEQFTPKKWRCNRCDKWNKVKGIYESKEYLKTCKCGRMMSVNIEVIVSPYSKYRTYNIIGLKDMYRRHNRTYYPKPHDSPSVSSLHSESLIADKREPKALQIGKDT